MGWTFLIGLSLKIINQMFSKDIRHILGRITEEYLSLPSLYLTHSNVIIFSQFPLTSPLLCAKSLFCAFRSPGLCPIIFTSSFDDLIPRLDIQGKFLLYLFTSFPKSIFKSYMCYWKQ